MIPSGTKTSHRLVGALLGAVLLTPIVWLASVCIGAPGFSHNTTSGGMWMLIAGVFIAPAGALVGALFGAFAVRRPDVLLLAVTGELLLGVIGAFVGRYIGSQLGEVDWGSAGLTHGALVGTLTGAIAGALYARKQLSRPGQTARTGEDDMRLWALWVWASALGWIAAEGAVRLALGWLTAASFVLYWSVVGALLGTGQWLVLRRRFAGVGWWVLASAVGLTAGSAATGFLPEFASNLGGPLAGALAGALLGVAQWLVLRPRVTQAGWWVLASAVGWAVGWAVGPFAWELGALAGAMVGAITGVALVWLLRGAGEIGEPTPDQGS